MLFLTFLLAVILVVINAIPQLSLAQAKGFKLKPTGLAYFVGAIGNLATGSIVPISAQAETISLSGILKKANERIGALLIASVFGVILGLAHGTSAIVDFAGPATISGMMAGVGIILSSVALDLTKAEKRTGAISIITALASWAVCNNYGIPNGLIWTIAVSVILSTLDFLAIQRRRVDLATIPADARETEEWRFWKGQFWADFKVIKPLFNISAILGGLSLICLNIGSNISFGSITASIAGQTPKLNALTVINSLADLPSALFGGAPIETIISGTAAAPWPWMAGVVMMLVCGFLLLTGVIGKLGRYIPSASISGFLVVIGFLLTFLPNLNGVMADSKPVAGIIALGVTALTQNAFIGVVVGTIVNLSGGLFGLI
jgi:AGZA family xanthine/uracil permease-like MFS transporter